MNKARIMIVDDEENETLDIQNRLTGLGYTVSDLAVSGEEAVVRVGEIWPDLVLIDIMLQGDIDGVTAGGLIHKEMDVPVIYLINDGDEYSIRRAKITEPYGYIFKPCNERELTIAIEMALYKHKMEKKIREREKWQAEILKSIEDAVIITNENGLIMYLNPVAETLTGWSVFEVFHKNLNEVFTILDCHTRKPVENPITSGILEDGEGLERHSLLVAKDGKEIFIDDRVVPIMSDNGNLMGVALVFRDVSERFQLEQERQISIELLRLANESTSSRDLTRKAVSFFQQQAGCKSVGIRLKEGEDYPYFEARGFPKDFLLAENNLCIRDFDGQLRRDEVGNPVLECMCGNIICGRFDSTKPFFTSRGSFWTNSTTQLLASTTESDRQARTRNRCNGEGYESVALIPLCFGKERLGLLQFNDRRKGVFKAETIEMWERLAGFLAIALAKFRVEEQNH